MLRSRIVEDRPGYTTLIGRIRANARAYVARQLELPRQEITEIVQANLRAAKWLAAATVLGLLALVSLVVLLVAIVAIWLPLPIAALLVTLLLGVVAGLAAWTGVRAIQIRGPERTIGSVKETMRWAKARLLGPNAS